jgi:large subunit ribosomal protein L4
MKADVVNLKLEKVSEIELSNEIFANNLDVDFLSMHFSRMKKKFFVKTAKTKNVSEVSGSKKKPYRQKGTGRARTGSMRTIIHRGGGIAFGPRAQQQDIKIPKSEALHAKKIALSFHNANKTLHILDNFLHSSNKTKDLIKTLTHFTKGEKYRKLLFISEQHDISVLLASRNLSNFSFVTPDMLTVFDLLNADTVLLDNKTATSFLLKTSV